MKHNINISKDCPCQIVEYISDIDLGVLQWLNEPKGKKPSESLTCRFCANDLPETQDEV